MQHDIWGDEITIKQKISHVNGIGSMVDATLYLIPYTSGVVRQDGIRRVSCMISVILS